MKIIWHEAKKLFWLLILVFFCSYSSSLYIEKKSIKILKELLFQLDNIHTINELLDRELILQRQFEKLVDLIIEAKKLQIDKTDNEELSNSLQKSMERIYQIDGGQEIMEHLQCNALQRLDRFEKILK